MILLELADFTDYFFLARTNDVDPLIEDYITRFERPAIEDILGVDLAEKFINDITGVDSDSSAIEERFQIILDPFTKQPSACIHRSRGMKDILKAIVYWNYVFRTAAKHTQSGVTLEQSETSNTFSPGNQAAFADEKHNEALDSIWAIQWWCGDEDHATYPEYNGTEFKPSHPLI